MNAEYEARIIRRQRMRVKTAEADYGDSRAFDHDQGSFGRWAVRAQTISPRDGT